MANWIQGAIKRPGAVRAKAKRAGESVGTWARAHQHDPGRSGKQARLAITLRKMGRARRRAT